MDPCLPTDNLIEESGLPTDNFIVGGSDLPMDNLITHTECAVEAED